MLRFAVFAVVLLAGCASQPPPAQPAKRVQAIEANNRLALIVRSEHPMRVAVQLRGGSDPTKEERWQRSVYIDERERPVVVDFGDMMPVGPTRTARAPLDQTPSVVLMVDTTNAKPESSGQVWIKRAVLQQRSTGVGR